MKKPSLFLRFSLSLINIILFIILIFITKINSYYFILCLFLLVWNIFFTYKILNKDLLYSKLYFIFLPVVLAFIFWIFNPLLLFLLLEPFNYKILYIIYGIFSVFLFIFYFFGYRKLIKLDLWENNIDYWKKILTTNIIIALPFLLFFIFYYNNLEKIPDVDYGDFWETKYENIEIPKDENIFYDLIDIDENLISESEINDIFWCLIELKTFKYYSSSCEDISYYKSFVKNRLGSNSENKEQELLIANFNKKILNKNLILKLENNYEQIKLKKEKANELFFKERENGNDRELYLKLKDSVKKLNNEYIEAKEKLSNYENYWKTKMNSWEIISEEKENQIIRKYILDNFNSFYIPDKNKEKLINDLIQKILKKQYFDNPYNDTNFLVWENYTNLIKLNREIRNLIIYYISNNQEEKSTELLNSLLKINLILSKWDLQILDSLVYIITLNISLETIDILINNYNISKKSKLILFNTLNEFDSSYNWLINWLKNEVKLILNSQKKLNNKINFKISENFKISDTKYINKLIKYLYYTVIENKWNIEDKIINKYTHWNTSYENVNLLKKYQFDRFIWVMTASYESQFEKYDKMIENIEYIKNELKN